MGKLNIDELNIIEKIRAAFMELSPVPCTGCRYCMPCPNNVAIPSIFEMYNECTMYDDFREGKMKYMGGIMGIEADQRATSCVECGECIKKCPQGISIPEQLMKAHEKLYDPDFKLPF